MTADWPVALRGVTESVVTTRGPDDGWQLAALGLHPGDPVSARTWGRTRTRRAFERAGRAVVQFTRDPVVFVEAALAARTLEDPVASATDAWVEARVERLDAGTDAGTEWVDWAVIPQESTVEEAVVPTIERGFNAVIEASVCASRLGVSAYDDDDLETRLESHRTVVDRCGSARDRTAMARLDELLSGGGTDRRV